MDERLVGREDELAAVDVFLERVGVGYAAVVLEGEAGIGKTTVWREGIERARRRGFTVLVSRPAEAESRLSFSALADLLEPVSASAWTELPEPQQRALDVALLRSTGDGAGVEPRAVAAALRGVLVHLAATVPVLVAVDDAQWLDAPSGRALEFVLRRLVDERVGLLAARRPAAARARDRLDVAGCERLELGPLSLAAVHELFKGRLGRSLPRPLLVRVNEVARGNPFYALEIAREALLSEVRSGDPLPVPRDLRRVAQRRLARLTPAAREALLVAAAAAEPTTALLSAALDRDVSPAVEEAEQSHVIELERDRVRFSHPLYAAAVYAAAPRERRRRVHQRLSEVVVDHEERARHLALAATAPSDEVATVLEKAAGEARRRGAPAAAAELSELALAHTPPDAAGAREERALLLVDHVMLAADSARARELLQALLPTLTAPAHRVRALLALADLVYWSSTSSAWSEQDNPIAYTTQAVAAAAGDAVLEARAHTALATYLESDSAAARLHAERALALTEGGAKVSSAVQAQALCALARSKLFRGDGLDVEAVERAIKLEANSAPPIISDRSSYKLGQWLKYVDQFDRSRSLLEQARQQAVDEGDDFSVVNILINLVILACWAGRWQVARTLGEELAHRLLQQDYDEPSPHVALVAALTADTETVEGLLRLKPWDGVFDVIRLRPLALLALSQGEFEAALGHCCRALERLELGGIQEPAIFRIHGDAIESAVRSGHTDEAAGLASSLADHAARSSIPWNTVISARSNALVAAARGDLNDALAAAELALEAHERLPMPFELGRTLLVKGEIERRSKRRAAAKQSLERARANFDELGAPLWSQRAREELQRIGLRRATGDELTDNERRVAELAASGLTNREVAGQLFMSPKTVEANLARVYRKLGIHSRAELGARLALGARDAGRT